MQFACSELYMSIRPGVKYASLRRYYPGQVMRVRVLRNSISAMRSPSELFIYKRYYTLCEEDCQVFVGKILAI